MKENDFVKIKSIDKYGVIQIPSKQVDRFGHRCFNSVCLEDGTVIMCRDDDIEIILLPKEE